MSSAVSHSSSVSTKEAGVDQEAAQARIAELESQIEGMIEQMPSSEPQGSGLRLQQLETERDAAQARVAELEGQVEAMIEQIGSSADEAVVALETDVVYLKKELRDAQQDSAHTHAMAAEAVQLLEEAKRERNAFQLQVHRLCCTAGAEHMQKGRKVCAFEQSSQQSSLTLICPCMFVGSWQCE